MKKNWFHFLIILAGLAILPALSMAGSASLSWQPNEERDLDGYRVYYGTSPRTYGPPLNVSADTTYTINDLDEGATYYFAVTAIDTSGNESGFSGEVSKTIAQTTIPSYQLMMSTSSDRSDPEQLSGKTILGDVYIFVTPEENISQVVFSIDGQEHNTENYAPYDLGQPFHTSTLNDGSHTISALVRLQDGRVQTCTSVCSVKNSTVQNDTNAPQLSLTAPTTGSAFTTDAVTITVAGTAADNVGVTQVSWRNSRGGSGTASLNSATGNWTATGIQLAEGDNTLIFEAEDAAGNQGSISLVVSFFAQDTVAPSIQISYPTSDSYCFSRSQSINLAGNAFDNIDVEKVTWSNSLGQSGTASGTKNWTIYSIPLNGWVTTITVIAHDQAGNTDSREVRVYYWPY